MLKYRTFKLTNVTKIENENQEVKASKFIYIKEANMRIGEVASSAEYQIDKNVQNLQIL